MTAPARSLALVQTKAVGFLQAIRDGTAERMRQDARLKAYGEVIFAYWAAKLHHPGAILDAKREKRILARLRESRGDWGLLCYAVDGALRDDFLMGRDQHAPRKYDGIETVFRDRAQVERLAELCPRFQAGELHPLVVKYKGGTFSDDKT